MFVNIFIFVQVNYNILEHFNSKRLFFLNQQEDMQKNKIWTQDWLNSLTALTFIPDLFHCRNPKGFLDPVLFFNTARAILKRFFFKHNI